MTAYDDSNVFARILRSEIPAQLLHQDEHCIAFRDIAPQAPTHILVIPRRAIRRLSETNANDAALLGHLLRTCAEVAAKAGLAADGYRVVVNDGARANQSVPHLHLHVLGGRDMSWPPG
jgi:histidine triad (HIT) family protein